MAEMLASLWEALLLQLGGPWGQSGVTILTWRAILHWGWPWRDSMGLFCLWLPVVSRVKQYMDTATPSSLH